MEPVKLKLTYSEYEFLLIMIRNLNFDIINWLPWQKIIIADLLKQIVIKITGILFRFKKSKQSTITLFPSQAQALLQIMIFQREFLQNYELSICSKIILEIDKK